MVERKKLGEVCCIRTGKLNANAQVENGKYPFFTCDAKPFRIDTFAFDTEAILISGNGSQVGHLNYYKGKFNAYQRTYVIDDFRDVNVFSLLHYLKSTIRPYVMDKSKKGSVPYITLPMLEGFIIPIPSLEEQTRIVGILDTFTSAIDNLKEQIAQRRKQYEYYRDQLLHLEGKPGVEMKFITDVAKSFTGLTYKPENVSDSGTLVLRSSNINDDVLSFDDNVFVQMEIPERARVQENDILICVRNGSKRLVGKAAMITKEAEGMAFGAFMTILRSFAINSKFLFYVWQSEKVRRQYKGDEAMPIAQITAKDFQRIVIPVPPLSEQQRIVSILDTFEASIQNLEAQLKQREKQYEYYRNKLLTFE